MQITQQDAKVLQTVISNIGSELLMEFIIIMKSEKRLNEAKLYIGGKK